MIKVLSVFGTRPEAIKMAPVIRALEKRPNQFVSRVCVTAQHRQMLDQILVLFGIRPEYDLDVMRQNQSSSQVAAAVLQKLEPILKAEKPDWVFVQGDTTTVTAAALAAFYANTKVGHVEAGLRTHDRYQPFPEEINRRIASVVADLHFAPTQRARANLLHEGIAESIIRVTGNTAIDALHLAAELPYDPGVGLLRNVPWNRRLILVTAHRRENFGEPIQQICLALKDIAIAYAGDVHIVYPVHMNPNIQEPVKRILGDVCGVTLTAPLEYPEIVYLMKRVTLVLTDSGGIQEEAPGFGKPVLVMREVTERPEGVECGTARVVGTERQEIDRITMLLLDNANEYDRMARAVNPYGDGHASYRIVNALLGEEDAGIFR
jgi:UDP-N-acetylglucosamine 2-epimerase (non-hydrolysing)